MRIQTKPYGELDIDERQIVHFPLGILGFEHLHEYVLLDAQPPFFWLQSLEVPDVAFVLIDPRIFRPEYDPDIPADELAEIDVKNLDECLLFSIVTIPENHQKMTANLMGPVIIAKSSHSGRQCITRNPEYEVRHLIMEELSRKRTSPC